MSHELRSPLTSILGFAELLRSDIAGPLNESQRAFIEDIHGAGSHLLSLVNDVLDLSRIDAGVWDLAPEYIDVTPFVERVVASFKERAASKGLQLHFDTKAAPTSIVADRRALTQVLMNLISNAIKFTERGEVTVRAGSEDGGGLVVEVADTGIGISPVDQEHIFEEFAQAHQGLDRPFEGTGLGLSIALKLAEASGGDIVCTSTPGAGSTFTLHLPPENEGVAPD
jgi:signal transduction histidine kinase